MKRMFVVLAILALTVAYAYVSVATAATNCGLGLYSSYVAGIGTKVDNSPVVQGWCRKTAQNGLYGELWLSQSRSDPGLTKRFGNEWDVTVGRDDNINEKWSYDVHAAHYDVANPRLFDGKGDIINAGGTLRFHSTKDTTVYTNVEFYEGYGLNRFHGGQRIGVGISSTLGPASYDVELRRNNHFAGIAGQFFKATVRSAQPIAKFGGGELRPEMAVYIPLGEYKQFQEVQVVGAIVYTW